MNINLLKAAMCKMDGFLGTISEMMEDPDIPEANKEELRTILDTCSSIEAKLMADYKQETGDEEAEFMQSTDFYDPDDFNMDKFPEYMDPSEDLENVIINEGENEE